MTGPPLCVRVSLFQTKTGLKIDAADWKLSSAEAPLQLIRSTSEDYRGDVLIPLSSLSSSSLASSSENVSGTVTAAHLLEGLEQRLSKYCVLHVPRTQAKTFMEENHLSITSVCCAGDEGDGSAACMSADDESVSSSESQAQQRTHSTRVCGRCSSSLTEAAAIAAGTDASRHDASLEKVPWIHVCQLQRMPGRFAVKEELPSSPSVEEWMRRLYHSTELFVSPQEADALGMAGVHPEDTVAGGECFAAFFQLTMVSVHERRKREACMVASMPSLHRPQTAAASSFFTVHALNNTVRIGVVPPPTTSLRSGTGPSSSQKAGRLAPPNVKSVVVDRLEAQRGVQVQRLVDPHTGAAVLPCESADTLLAASVTTLTAECHPTRSARTAPDALTQQMSMRASPHTQSLTATDDTSGAKQRQKKSLAQRGSPSDLFEDLVGLRARRQADASQYYFRDDDDLGAHDWADQRTAISLSELPSESELRMTSVASHGSQYTVIYPHSSTSRQHSLGSRTTASLFTASADNSRSQPFAILPNSSISATSSSGSSDTDEEEEEEAQKMSSSSGVIAAMPKPVAENRRGSDTNSEKDAASAQAFVAALVARNTALGSRSPDAGMARHSVSPIMTQDSALTGLRDSLLELNEVFVYEEDETVKDLQGESVGLDVGAGDKRAAPSASQRRSSLVWSTPAARGAGVGLSLAESGLSATPLTYRTSTQLSRSPQNSPAVTAAEVIAQPMHHARSSIVQRLDFPLSSSSPPTSDASAASSHTDGEDHCGDDEDKSVAEEERSDEEVLSYQESRSGSSGSSGNGSGESNPDASRAASPTPETSSNSPLHAGNYRQPISDEATNAFTPPRMAAEKATVQHHFACTPPSSPSPSSKVVLSSAYTHSFHASDEQTTPLPSSSTPASRSCTSEVELRSQLQALNPVETQVSVTENIHGELSEGIAAAMYTPPLRVAGKRAREDDARAVTAAGVPVSRMETGGRLQRTETALYQYDSSSNASAATPPRSLTRPDAKSEIVSPARGSGSVISSLPSTVVASRPPRHRSPIYFSPEELAHMTNDPLAPSDSSSMSNLFSSPESQKVDEERRRKDASTTKGARRPREDRYGPFVASYPLQSSDEDDSGNFPSDAVARWDDTSNSATPVTASATRQHPQLLSTPQRARISAGFGITRTVDPTLAQPFGVARGGSAHSSQVRRPFAEPALVSSETGSADVLSGVPRVTSQRLRRSASHSASGMETWVRFSDVDTEDASNTGVVGRVVLGIEGEDVAGDEEEVMLVTQQEIPDYTGEGDSSMDSNDASEEEEVESSTSSFSDGQQ